MTRRTVTSRLSDNIIEILKDIGPVLYYGSYWVTYALKSFPDEELREVASQCASRQEMRIVEERMHSLMALHHPNIVECKQVFVHNSLLYYRTKHYSRSLEHEMRQNLREGRRMSEEQILHVACQIAQGLAYLHDPKKKSRTGYPLPVISHGDVCPANILVSESKDQFVLANCGVWCNKLFGLVSTISKSYTAPEVLCGQEGNPAADMWSLGVVIYELSTGKLNEPGGERGWGELSEVPSEHLKQVLSHLLLVNPAERATAKELSAIIDGLGRLVSNQTNEYQCSSLTVRQNKHDFTNQEPEATPLYVLLSSGAKALVDAVCESGMDATGLGISWSRRSGKEASAHVTRRKECWTPKM
ncbi:Kinase, NEK [Giardia lamblia P15]|uniref:non-specific serine/threonine protein kinase n=1 Tax=Giardia intestinalis (strain P15) TaxID=658858 RepID=E1F412_GIAIA|nr:Kinase, NEK [Giardia lamblia P15]